MFATVCAEQGAFKSVASEVMACVDELTGILRQQLGIQPDSATECITKLSKLGAPTEPLQEAFLDCKRQRLETILAACGLMLKRLAMQSGLLEPGSVSAADLVLRQKMEQLFPGSSAAGVESGGEELPSLKQVIITLNSQVGHAAERLGWSHNAAISAIWAQRAGQIKNWSAP